MPDHSYGHSAYVRERGVILCAASAGTHDLNGIYANSANPFKPGKVNIDKSAKYETTSF